MNPQQLPPLQPKVVLAVGAHPDDMDFGAGGTLATFAAMGAEIHYLQLTDGGSGSSDHSVNREQVRDIRKEEQQHACDILGGKGVEFLDYCDGCLTNNLELKTAIVKTIRRLQPDVVITMDPTMVYSDVYGIINHPDHRAAGQAVLDAVYPLARDHLSLPELYATGYKPHKVSTVLLINFDRSNYNVDVSEQIQTRIKVTEAHVSQNGANMATTLVDMARQKGDEYGCEYAESFIRLDIQ